MLHVKFPKKKTKNRNNKELFIWLQWKQLAGMQQKMFVFKKYKSLMYFRTK